MSYLAKTIRNLFLITISVVAISACAPSQTIERNVVPTLFSITHPNNTGPMLYLQGRYFGDGKNFQSGNSYVILGADVNGRGGIQVTPTAWSTTKLSIAIPENAGAGFVFVVVDGAKSNGLPANIQ